MENEKEQQEDILSSIEDCGEKNNKDINIVEESIEEYKDAGNSVQESVEEVKNAGNSAKESVQENKDAGNSVKESVEENKEAGKPVKVVIEENKEVGSTVKDCIEGNDEHTMTSINSVEGYGLTGGVNDQSDVNDVKNNGAEPGGCGMFLLKMAKKGIVSMFFENRVSDDPVDVLSKVLEDLENGLKHSPKWCQRIIPIQATCLFSKETIRPVVFELVKRHLGESLPTESQPLKFAIGYNKRGTDQKGAIGKDTELFGRLECIKVVTEGVAQAAHHVVVNLREPQMVVIVEVIPISGVHDTPVCGVAVVSGQVVNTKPKLCVKPFPQLSHLAKKLKR